MPVCPDSLRSQTAAIKAPKTKHSRRTISLPDFLVEDLRKHRQAQLQQRLALGLGKMPTTAWFLATSTAARGALMA